MDFILPGGYTVCYATHQPWLQSPAWKTLLFSCQLVQPTVTQPTTACQLDWKEPSKTLPSCFFLCPLQKTVCFLIQIGQKFLCRTAKSSGNASCVQKRQPGPVNHWALKRSQEENNSFSWSYRNVLFIMQPGFYELQQPEHKREMQFPPFCCGREEQCVLRSWNEGLLNCTGVKSSQACIQHVASLSEPQGKMLTRNTLSTACKTAGKVHFKVRLLWVHCQQQSRNTTGRREG